MPALLTDLYELTMAAGYFESGKLDARATFELSIRRLPEHRSHILVAGVEQALEYLVHLKFTQGEIEYLRTLPVFTRASEGFFQYLAEFRFTGDVWAVAEGTPVFSGESILRITAPIIEAQIPETYLLAAITFPSLVATKASRMVQAAAGRPVVEFGTRRAHTAEAGTLGARAAYIGGCIGTSNAEAGYRFGVPVLGTAAHSWTMAFESEREAFEKLQGVLGEHTVYLVDTYDAATGVENAASIGRPFWGIRLDSGDLLEESRKARRILDGAGCQTARIMASGDLNEYRIAELVRAGAPIDAFGVGTELAVSADAPSMGTIYKLVEIEERGEIRATAKRSPDKGSVPGAKQVFRFAGHDVVGLAAEEFPGAVPLLEPVIAGGRRVKEKTPLDEIRKRAQERLSAIENPETYPVRYSDKLQALLHR